MEATSLINIQSGERKYLNREERQAFKLAAKDMEPTIQTFCLMIYYTGCRLSEALEVTPNRLDFDEQRVLLRTLKQNKQKPDKPDRYRLVELPRSFLASLESNFQARSRKGTNTGMSVSGASSIVPARIISKKSWSPPEYPA